MHMYRYIRASEDSSTNANLLYKSQEELKSLREQLTSVSPDMRYPSADEMSPQDQYFLAENLGQETANPDNFFQNSVGFWVQKSSAPKREPDFDSTKMRWNRSGYPIGKTKGSRYWYADKGVYRKSDHWGGGVASCSWYLEGWKNNNSSVTHTGMITAFIPWDGLRPKGTIVMNNEKDYNAFPNLQKIFTGIDVEDYFEANGVLYRPMGFYFKK